MVPGPEGLLRDAGTGCWGCAGEHRQAPGELGAAEVELCASAPPGRTGLLCYACASSPRSWVPACLFREVASPVTRCEMISVFSQDLPNRQVVKEGGRGEDNKLERVLLKQPQIYTEEK